MLLAAAAELPAQESPDGLRQNAIALERDGKVAEAESAWRALSQARPSNPEPYAHLGLLEARQTHYKQAIPLYRKALSIDPSVAGVRRDLGLALFKSDDLRAAIREFDVLLKSQPDDFQLTTLTGMSYYGLAEYRQAVPYLRRAASIDKQNLPIRLAIAHSCLWSKQYQCVMDTYHEILALNADSAEADMLAGEALDEMKDNEGATKLFRDAAAENPKEPNVHFGLAYLLWTQKRYADAAAEFKAELENDPHHVQAAVYLADSDLQLNLPDEAKPLLETALKEDSKQPLAHLDLGIIYSDKGQNEDALRELKEAERLTPDKVDIHWRLARLYRAMGRKAEAQAEFDKARALNKAEDDRNYERIANAHPRAAETTPDTTTAAPAATPPNQ